jgi:hypothetical protein
LFTHFYKLLHNLLKNYEFQVALSREAVNFMMEELNLNRLLDAFEWNAHGVDEQLMGTLNSNDAIDLPGGFTLQCLRRGYEVSSLMRFVF